jgi:hypothetical protein
MEIINSLDMFRESSYERIRCISLKKGGREYQINPALLYTSFSIAEYDEGREIVTMLFEIKSGIKKFLKLLEQNFSDVDNCRVNKLEITLGNDQDGELLYSLSSIFVSGVSFEKNYITINFIGEDLEFNLSSTSNEAEYFVEM